MLNVLSLFSGIGAFEKALKNLNIPYNLLAYCEIDKHASKSYSIIHDVPESMNLHDVTKVDMLDIEDRVDLITYGFPCQDISNAGKQKGFTDENGERTRSGLFFEALRIIEDYRPKFAIAENVKALTSKKFTEEFKTVLESLEDAGYNNYWQVLNAKDYGIPQNRERVFIISIRKDIDNGFTFPEPIPLELRLKDILEETVDEKFYLSDDTLQKLVVNLNPTEVSGVDKSVNNPRLIDKANCITAREDRGVSKHKAEGTAGVEVCRTGPHQKDGVYSEDGLSPTITATSYKQPTQICVKEATKQGYASAYPGDSVNLEHPNSKTRRGRVGKEVAQTLTTSCNQAVVVPDVVRLGGLYDTEKSTRQAGSVYDKNGVSPTLSTM